MHIALENHGLERINVIHAGDATSPPAERIRALPLKRIPEDLEPLD